MRSLLKFYKINIESIMDIARTIQQYENELVNPIIPFCQNNCVDKEYQKTFFLLPRKNDNHDFLRELNKQYQQ
jgi:hypothetical protein